MFEKASRLKLRFPSNQGLLHTEDLWDLSLQELNVMAKTLRKDLAETEEEDYLDDVSQENETAKLLFDVTLHILKTKKEEARQRREAKERKADREKILEILAKKKDAGLENMTEEELRQKLEELG